MPLYFTPEEKIQKAVDLPASSSTPKSLPSQQEPIPNSNNLYKIQKGDSFWKLEKNLNLKNEPNNDMYYYNFSKMKKIN